MGRGALQCCKQLEHTFDILLQDVPFTPRHTGTCMSQWCEGLGVKSGGWELGGGGGGAEYKYTALRKDSLMAGNAGNTNLQTNKKKNKLANTDNYKAQEFFIL